MWSIWARRQGRAVEEGSDRASVAKDVTSRAVSEAMARAEAKAEVEADTEQPVKSKMQLSCGSVDRTHSFEPQTAAP